MTHARDIALTNCILAGLRELLGAQHETYSKWWYGGSAFNGASFQTQPFSGATVLFCKQPMPQARGEVSRFSQGVVYVQEAEALGQNRFDAAVKAAEQRFGALQATQGGALLTQVSRLQMWCHLRSTPLDTPTDEAMRQLVGVGDQLRSELSAMRLLSGMEPTGGPLQWNGDVEIEFSEPRSLGEVRGVLQRVFPGFAGELFDPMSGGRWRSGEMGSCALPHVEWIQIIARQF